MAFTSSHSPGNQTRSSGRAFTLADLGATSSPMGMFDVAAWLEMFRCCLSWRHSFIIWLSLLTCCAMVVRVMAIAIRLRMIFFID